MHPSRRLPERDLDACAEQAEAAFQSLRGARILMTGGTGFFGRWMLESFSWSNLRLALGAQLTVVTRDPVKFCASAPHMAADPSIDFVSGDVRSFDCGDRPFSHVIHAATTASQALNERAPLEMIDTIVGGTRRILDVAERAGAARVLFVSSGAVYGAQPDDVSHVPESFRGGPDTSDPRNAYAEAKRLGELLCAIYARETKSAVVVARAFAFVGPHLPLSTHFAIGNFIRDALSRPSIVIKGDGTPIRSYLYAGDLAVWLWTLLARGRGGQTYNVGSEDARSLRAVAEIVGGLEKKPLEIRSNPRPDAKPMQYVPATLMARTELGLAETVPLADAIERTMSWYRQGHLDSSS